MVAGSPGKRRQTKAHRRPVVQGRALAGMQPRTPHAGGRANCCLAPACADESACASACAHSMTNARNGGQ
eukprot:135428-Alexandrium_andersonii.AAC.1